MNTLMHLCLHTTHQKACLVSITKWLCMVVVKSTKSFTYYTTSKWHPRIVESFPLSSKANFELLCAHKVVHHLPQGVLQSLLHITHKR